MQLLGSGIEDKKKQTRRENQVSFSTDNDIGAEGLQEGCITGA